MTLSSRVLGCLFTFALPVLVVIPAVAQSPRPRSTAVQVMDATGAEVSK